ncbi:hypothetical protein D9M68_637400 [compost metagenome]
MQEVELVEAIEGFEKRLRVLRHADGNPCEDTDEEAGDAARKAAIYNIRVW